MNEHLLDNVIAQTRIVDTHEHILPRADLGQELGLMALLGRSYLMSELVSAGMPPDAWGRGSDSWRRAEYAPAEQIWDAMQPYLPAVKDSGFYGIWQAALGHLYDVPEAEITTENWRDISEDVRRNYSNAGWMSTVLYDRARFDAVVVDNYWRIDDPTPAVAAACTALRANTFIYGPGYTQRNTNNTTVEDIADSWDMPLASFQDYLDLVERAFALYSGNRLVAVKIAVAYERDLAFDSVPDAELSSLFAKVLAGQCAPEVRRRFQDGMVHHVLRMAETKRLPVQVHTGLQGGNSNVVGNTDPAPLARLFIEYPDVRFSLLHMGYPFVDQALALAKMFPNVYLDMAWHAGLSPYLAVDTLKKAIGTMPVNKITWGADSHIVEEAYGASVVFRAVLRRALDDMMRERGMDERRAAEVAVMIMRTNAASLFGIDVVDRPRRSTRGSTPGVPSKSSRYRT